MEIKSFHHPDLCPAVIKRRAVEQMLDLMVETAAIFATRGRYLLWKSCYPSNAAYHTAVSRLRKAGIVAYRREGGKIPVLKLTHEGEKRVSRVCRRRAPWPEKWNGIWYVLTYDVPEKERTYREVLRSFLKRMRMGSLQKSVWVSAHDIRPEYDDLVKAGGVDEFSFLFESRTVLGRCPGDVVDGAWDMHRLGQIQQLYLDVYKDNLARVASGKLGEGSILTLSREELSAYVTVMSEDPLLPKPLWPSEYSGEEVWHFHRQFVRTVAKAL